MDSNKTELKGTTLKCGPKILTVSRCRPALSTETVLATRQELFFTKVASVQSITNIVLSFD